MSSWTQGERPITLAILAMGGEGGGVLSDWIVALARGAGWYAQNTSVAGVAQRTGATVYYVEIYPPVAASGRGRPEPVLSLFPTPGEVDVVVASELMECGRAVQRGFCTPDRTTLITSTNRVYSIAEKSGPGDARVDSAELLAAARRGSRRLIAEDFMHLAEQARSVISAALFGALAGSGALPFGRVAFEQCIREAGKGVEPSLAAFDAGFAAATAAAAPVAPAAVAGVQDGPAPTRRRAAAVPVSIGPRPQTVQDRKDEDERRRTAVAATEPAALVGPALRELATTVLDDPPAARSTILHGLTRTAVYQDLDYAQRYLDRVRGLAALDPDRAGAARLSVEAARHVALWMCYQDTIHVALQKTREGRAARIRDEARAGRHDLVEVREYLHPQLDEIVDTMPAGLGARVARSRTFQRVVHRVTQRGLIVNTSSVPGFAALVVTARLRPLRPRSLRFVREQDAIERWLALAVDTARTDPDLAREIVECQRVLKGYGATYAHGTDSFERLMAAARRLSGGGTGGSPGPGGAARVLASLRAAALADEDGAALTAALASASRAA